MMGLIDQMGLRIRMSKSYQESLLNLQPGALVISKKLRITFTCFQTKAAPIPRVQIQIQKPGIGKDKSHVKSAVVKKKNSPNIRYVGLDAGRETAYSKVKRHRMTDW